MRFDNLCQHFMIHAMFIFLFFCPIRARIILKGMIKTLIDKKYTPEMKKKAIAQLLNNLNEILVHSDVSKEFLAQRLLPAVMNSPQMRLLLLRLSYSNKSCKDNYRTMVRFAVARIFHLILH